jgi:hypothetical protein
LLTIQESLYQYYTIVASPYFHAGSITRDSSYGCRLLHSGIFTVRPTPRSWAQELHRASYATTSPPSYWEFRRSLNFEGGGRHSHRRLAGSSFDREGKIFSEFPMPTCPPGSKQCPISYYNELLEWNQACLQTTRPFPLDRRRVEERPHDALIQPGGRLQTAAADERHRPATGAGAAEPRAGAASSRRVGRRPTQSDRKQLGFGWREPSTQNS